MTVAVLDMRYAYISNFFLISRNHKVVAMDKSEIRARMTISKNRLATYSGLQTLRPTVKISFKSHNILPSAFSITPSASGCREIQISK